MSDEAPKKRMRRNAIRPNSVEGDIIKEFAMNYQLDHITLGVNADSAACPVAADNERQDLPVDGDGNGSDDSNSVCEHNDIEISLAVDSEESLLCTEESVARKESPGTCVVVDEIEIPESPLAMKSNENLSSNSISDKDELPSE